LPGFYPDPSICRVDSDYYLVHWKQLGHVLDRPSQLNLDSLQLSYGVFAPAIQYHDGIFYVINTIVYGGGNFNHHDDFNDTTLSMTWNFIRTPRSQWYSLSSNPGLLKMELQSISIRELKNPSFIGRRQQHAFFCGSNCIAARYNRYLGNSRNNSISE